jgi:hypothetical protein
MKQLLLICAVVAYVCFLFLADRTPLVEITDPIVEKAIRKALKKPKGKLTEADLAKVTRLPPDVAHQGTGEDTSGGNEDNVFTQITEAGLKEVAKCTQLTSLSLNATQITDEGLKEVAKLQKLTYLDLRDTEITKAGVAELKKALPECEIQSNAR